MNQYGFEKYINNPSLNNTVKYVVKNGDSLYTISKQYNTTPEVLMKLNNLATTLIYPNQILFIPSNKVSTRDGQTIGDILKERGLSYDIDEAILNMKLMPNQDYVSPNKIYLINASDNLDSILRKTGLSPYELIILNQNNWLKNGEKIIIK